MDGSPKGCPVYLNLRSHDHNWLRPRTLAVSDGVDFLSAEIAGVTPIAKNVSNRRN